MADAPATARKKIAALRAAYLSGLPAKLEKIETVASVLTPDTPIEEARAVFRELHERAHKLVGPAGAYGLSNLSQIARYLELSCLELFEKGDEVSAQNREEIDRLITLLHEASEAGADVAMMEPSLRLEETARRDVTGDTVILVEDDETQARMLKMLLSNFGFTVRALSHPSALPRTIAESPPSVVIMDIVFPGDPDAGVNAVRELRNEGVLTCPVVYLSVRDDFPARLKAARAGSDGYVVKPVDIIDLVETLNRLISRPRNARPHVLIVEDDAETAAYYGELLVGAGMTTEVVTDPMRATEALLGRVADVILMDINMPGCNGLDLALVLRQMGVEFQHIPIVFLTAEEGVDQRAIAIRQGGDDFVSKPVDPAFLISSVLARAERSRKMNALIWGLKAGRERLRSVTQSASDAIITSDEGGLIISWNASAERIFGYGEDSVLGWPLTKLMPEGFHKAHRKGFARVVSGGESRLFGTAFEFMGLHRNGAEIPLEFSLSRWSSLGKTYFTAIMRDITERKHAEQALRQSEATLVRAQRQAKIGSWQWSIERKALVTCSREYARIHGVTMDSVHDHLSRQIEQVVHRDDRERVEAQFKQADEKGMDFDIEYRIVRPDGGVRHVQQIGEGVFDDAGRPIAHVGTIQDVTARKLAERELEESREILRALADNLPEFISLKDSEGRFLFINKRFEEWVRVDWNEIVGKTVHDIYSAEQAAEFDALDRKAIASRSVLSKEVDLHFPDGNTRAVVSTRFPVMSSDGKVLGLGTVNIDVSEQKRIQQALGQARDELERRVAERTAELRESEARLRAIMDNSPNGFLLKDVEGRYRVINRRFEEWYGLSADNVLGKTSHELFPKDRADKHIAIDHEVRETGTVVQYERSLPLADGNEHRIVITKFPVHNANREYLGIGAITSDVTEQRLAEEQLRQAQKLDTLGQLSGGIAHDFNNILAVILGHAELLQDRLANGDISVGAIEMAASRGAELTHRLLSFSREQKLQPKPVNLHGLVVGMMDMLHRTLGENIELENACDPDLWTALADPGQVENAILNLAINARDAMPDGGELAIDCWNLSLDSESASRFSDATPGDFIMLVVSDTGCGMSPQVRDRVFEPFYTTKEVGKGTGLGLSMIYGFAKQSGGFVTIESQVTHGTTVRLYLPRTEASEHADPQETTEDLPKARGETILVLEDEPGVRELAAGMLESVGYRVLEAGDGKAATAALEKVPRIDLLLSDVVLPGGMSGPELAAEARRRHGAIKVLYMSGYADDTIHHRHLKDTDLINKPFRKRELVRKVRAVLEAESPSAPEPARVAGVSEKTPVEKPLE